MIDDVPPHHGAALAAELRTLTRRRILVAVLVAATIGLVLLAFVRSLGGDGLSSSDLVLIGLFAVTLPWLVIGFWNAIIGLVIAVITADPALTVCPAIGRSTSTMPIRSRTAILIPAHNEDPASLFRHLAALSDSLAASAAAAKIGIFLLSDTSDPGLAAEEERHVAAWRATAIFPDRLHYRRRPDNEGHKTGNLWEFLDRRGSEFEFGLVLDADSLMSGEAVARLIRIMQANPEIGILQHLTVGLPTAVPFARLFQIGMRHGMRTYSLGSAWWQGDCGPFWGHNALVRLKPFMAHCRLPELPGAAPWGGRILSHDQVEAVLMRRAGWQVRLAAIEDGSFELTPPTLIEFIGRDLRWGQGNLQYLNLLPRLQASSMARLQLILASLMYVIGPASLAFALLAFGRAVVPGFSTTAPGSSLTAPELLGTPGAAEPWLLLLLVLGLTFAPKLTGALVACIDGTRAAAFGGRVRIVATVVLELVFSLLLTPIMLLSQARLVLGMARGRTIAWAPQRRAHCPLRWPEALRSFRVEMAAGACLLAAVHLAAPQLWVWSWLVGGPLLLAPLFAVTTASAAFGRRLVDAGLGLTPEEQTSPETVERAGHRLATAGPIPNEAPGKRPAALARELG